MDDWFVFDKVIIAEKGANVLPSVSECFRGALDELKDGTSDGAINAAIYLATASRSMEREGFKMMIHSVESSSTAQDTTTAEFVKDGMEDVFDHLLEAIGHICFSLSGGKEQRQKRFISALEQAEHSFDGWTKLQQLAFQKQPLGVQ